MTDFTIEVKGLEADMAFEKSDSLANNIYLSLQVKKGSFFLNTSFGSRLHEIRKVTAPNIALAEAYCGEALRWLLWTGRVKSIEVTAERDTDNAHRINILVTALRHDGTSAAYQVFYSVV